MVMNLQDMDKALVDGLVRIDGILNMMRQGTSIIVIYEKIQGLRDRLGQSLKEVRMKINDDIVLNKTNETDTNS